MAAAKQIPVQSEWTTKNTVSLLPSNTRNMGDRQEDFRAGAGSDLRVNVWGICNKGKALKIKDPKELLWSIVYTTT